MAESPAEAGKEIPELLAEWDRQRHPTDEEAAKAINPQPADAWNADEERLEYQFDDFPDERDAALASLEVELAERNETIANSEFQQLLSDGAKRTSLTADEITEQWKQAITDDNVHALEMVEAFDAGDKEGYTSARDAWMTELELLNPPADPGDDRSLFAAVRFARESTPSDAGDFGGIAWGKLTDQEFAVQKQKVFEAAERGAFRETSTGGGCFTVSTR